MLIVYVDDFKLAGPKANLAKGWQLIGSKIKMEPAQPVGRFLGCEQIVGSMYMRKWTNPRYEWMKTSPCKKEPPIIFSADEARLMNDTSQPNVPVTVMRYEMSDFLDQCVQRYVELAGDKIIGKLKHVTTPFLDESKPDFDENDIMNKIKAGRKAALDKGQDPAYDSAYFQGGGVLANIASKVLMKIYHAARMGRFDLLRAVNALGSRITSWTKLCDEKLRRLVCYIKSTLHLKMHA